MQHLQTVADSNPSFVNKSVEGTTFLNNDIVLMKIGNSPNGSETRIVYMDFGWLHYLSFNCTLVN